MIVASSLPNLVRSLRIDCTSRGGRSLGKCSPAPLSRRFISFAAGILCHSRCNASGDLSDALKTTLSFCSVRHAREHADGAFRGVRNPFAEQRNVVHR